MAMRKGNPVRMLSGDEGFPISRRVDGVNTREVAGREGYQRNLGTNLDSHREWRNSKTGARMDPPEWAQEDCFDY